MSPGADLGILVGGGVDLENSENVTATFFATPIIYLQHLSWVVLGGGG